MVYRRKKVSCTKTESSFPEPTVEPTIDPRALYAYLERLYREAVAAESEGTEIRARMRRPFNDDDDGQIGPAEVRELEGGDEEVDARGPSEEEEEEQDPWDEIPEEIEGDSGDEESTSPSTVLFGSANTSIENPYGALTEEVSSPVGNFAWQPGVDIMGIESEVLKLTM